MSLRDEACAWLADDPDPTTRAELGAMLDSGADLADHFAGPLAFGTAGLRGPLGPGPNRMNRAVVIRAAAGLVAYLREQIDAPLVVVGYDARTNSEVFAHDTAAVVTAAGGTALVLPGPLPTPVLAFAVRHLHADAGVMVTASHNPAQDNGYKVYLGDGIQIVPPADAQIAQCIAAAGPVADIPRARGWQVVDVEQAYLDAVTSLVREPRPVRVVHTALHGAGAATARRAFEQAGLVAPLEVSTQSAPDPAFPTVAFPNPEEPGALDAALALAARTDAELVVAHDPDADRCAVAVPSPEGWRVLTGDELGAVLGWAAIERIRESPSGPTVLASSFVSSRRLAALARAAGLPHVETPTGFKWIARVPGLAYGYEEALGYCLQPDVVGDKDGIAAALAVTELVGRLAAQGRSLLDLLDDVDRIVGVHATDAFSIRTPHAADLVGREKHSPPTHLAGRKVRVDEPHGALRYLLDDDSRVVVRASGTEPKLKVYLEAVVPGDLPAARAEAARRLHALRAAMTERLA